MIVAHPVFDPVRLASNESAPLYARIKKLVAEAIDKGELQIGDAVPSERDVAVSLDVSRVTVRKAFVELVAEGVLVQKRGSGTYVGSEQRRIEQPLSRLTSFTEDMRSRGLHTVAEWIDRNSGLPSPDEALKLSISPSEQVSRFHRLRRAGDAPLAVELAVIPARFLPEPAVVEDSLYAALGERGFMPVRALQRLHAIGLGRREARWLHLPEGSPALFIERVSYLADGSVVEYTRSHYRGDSYDFVAELKLAGTADA
jgi:GntR family transcriptional regulator